MSALNHYGPSTGIADVLLGQRAPLFFDASLTFKTPKLQHVLDVWNQKRGARCMPARKDFTIRDLGCVAPQLCIVQVVHEDGRRRFKIKLMGTILDHYLAPITGKFVDEAVPPQFLCRWTSMYASALDRKAPMRITSRVAYRDQLYLVCEGLVLPLADDGQTPSGVLFVIFHYGGDMFDDAQCQMYNALSQELDQEFGFAAAVTS